MAQHGFFFMTQIGLIMTHDMAHHTNKTTKKGFIINVKSLVQKRKTYTAYILHVCSKFSLYTVPKIRNVKHRSKNLCTLYTALLFTILYKAPEIYSLLYNNEKNLR